MAANTSFLKRLVKEDFDTKYQDLVSKIAFVLNPAIDQMARTFNKGLAISDLNTQVKQLTLVVDANGVPSTDASFASTLSGRCNMIQIGRAQNLTNPTTYPSSGVLVSFAAENSQAANSNQIIIKHITGLTVGDQWQLTLIAYV